MLLGPALVGMVLFPRGSVGPTTSLGQALIQWMVWPIAHAVIGGMIGLSVGVGLSRVVTLRSAFASEQQETMAMVRPIPSFPVISAAAYVAWGIGGGLLQWVVSIAHPIKDVYAVLTPAVVLEAVVLWLLVGAVSGLCIGGLAHVVERRSWFPRSG